jgi:uncharacterized protein (UPF0276 family)
MDLKGFGLGLRAEHLGHIADTERTIDWLEIIAENWIETGGTPRRHLERCAERWTIVPHGISMSIGGSDPLSEALFRDVSTLCRQLDAPFWSDHICFSSGKGAHYSDLLPLPSSDEALEHLVRRIAIAQSMTDVPLVFENPTYYARMPGETMSEAQFLAEVAKSSGGLLLDVNNVYVNSQNHGFEPEAFVRALPLNHVRQIHLAGHTRWPDVIVDTHVGPIPEEVWSLYRYVTKLAGRVIPTLIEWDTNVPALDELIDELDRARAEAQTSLASLAVAA